MIEFTISPEDDPEFIERIRVLTQGVLATVRPNQFFLVEVDQWFDHKWLGFSGKVLGALGLHLLKLTLPPFNPHRIKWQRHFIKSDIEGEYEYDGPGYPLAVLQNSCNNLRRRVANRKFSSSVLCWFSGSTKKLGRGSLMVYYNTPSEDPKFLHTHHWYVGFERDPVWKIVCHKLISERELDAFDEIGRRPPLFASVADAN